MKGAVDGAVKGATEASKVMAARVRGMGYVEGYNDAQRGVPANAQRVEDATASGKETTMPTSKPPSGG